MRAVRGNKEYTIGEAQKRAYRDAGYDILDDAGTVISHGRNKTVPYGDHEALKAENGELRAENEGLKLRISELEGAAEDAVGIEDVPKAENAAEKKGAAKKGKTAEKAGE